MVHLDVCFGTLAAWERLRPLVALVACLLNSGGQHAVNGLTSSKSLVHLNQFANAVDDQLYELTLRLTKTGKIGDIVGGVLSQG